MTQRRALSVVTLFGCIALLLGLNASAFASCGDSMAAMAAAAAAIHNQASPIQPSSPLTQDSGVNPSIIGFWHIRFVVGDQTIQEAYQIWNTGGTEVHNPNVDPRTGNVCLGVWTAVSPRGYKLTHRVWWYDAGGNFQGTIHLSETVALGDMGNSHGGSFKLDFYDPNNNFLFEVTGNVVAERVSGD
jgi:hypothetical protein